MTDSHCATRAGIPDIVLHTECCICKGTFEAMEPDTRICQLPCKHAMCAECIEAWFETTDLGEDEGGPIRSRKSCPECRRGFASLRKSDTATLADIIALQRRQAEDALPATAGGSQQQPAEPARGKRPCALRKARARRDDGTELKCEQCARPIDGTYGAGRFCDRTCTNRWISHEGMRARGQLGKSAARHHRCPRSRFGRQRAAAHRVPWTDFEDQLVIRMVQEEGVGHWDSKADRLGTGRTGDGTYQRWRKYLQRPRSQLQLLGPPDSDGDGRRLRKRVRADDGASSLRSLVFRAGETVDCPNCNDAMRAPVAAHAIRCAHCRVVIAAR